MMSKCDDDGMIAGPYTSAVLCGVFALESVNGSTCNSRLDSLSELRPWLLRCMYACRDAQIWTP